MTAVKKLTMDDLLKKEQSFSIQQLRRGDIVEGIIIEVNEREALVDVGAKSEGVIPQAEIKNGGYKAGDKVLVYVMTPEDRRGQMVVSLRRAETYKSWSDMEEAFKTGATLDFVITGHNRGGLLGDVKGLVGFVPFSHSESASDLSLDKAELQSLLDKMTGDHIKTRIIELDREKNRIILSEKEAAIGDALEKRKEKIVGLNVGDTVKTKVTAVMPYGLVVSVSGVEGMIAREEIAWDEESIDEMLGSFEMDQELDAQIVDIDKEMGKIKLSIKTISSNPWEDLVAKYKVNDVAVATVSRITSYGVFATLEGSIEGMIPLSSIPDNEKLEVGKPVNVVIEVLDAPKRRLDLNYSVQD
jgi:small subunit ribosomal protein S1